MDADAVGLEIAVELGEGVGDLALLPRPRDPAHAVAMTAPFLEESEQGLEGEEDGRRIAARIRDEPRAGELLTAPLGEAVDRFLEEPGAGCSKPYHFG